MTTGFWVSLGGIIVMWYLALMGILHEQNMTLSDLFRLIMEKFRSIKKEDKDERPVGD